MLFTFFHLPLPPSPPTPPKGPHQAVDDELLDDRVVGADGVAAPREVEQLDVLGGVDLVVGQRVDAPGGGGGGGGVGGWGAAGGWVVEGKAWVS
jgi:hypothetical protein